MATGQLFSRTTQALFYNYKQLPLQQMLDFDFLSRRETPSVAGIINPGSEGLQKIFFGQKEIVIPVHATIEGACAAHPTADVFVNFASHGGGGSSMCALKQATIRVVAVMGEGLAEADTKQLIAYASANNKVVIGPGTVGSMQAGAFKIGDTAVTIDNIIHCKLYRPGSVGFVSKSGETFNELCNTISRVTDGIYEAIAIGGDVCPGSTLFDHVLRFNNIPQIKIMVVVGEHDGCDEYSIVEALKQGKVSKPVVAWVSGRCAGPFKSAAEFGEAGDKSGCELEFARAKNQALKDAGAVVPTSYQTFETALKETFHKLVEEGKITPVKEITPPPIPEDLSSAIKSGKVRAPTHIISTISDERGEDQCYGGVSMSSIIEKGYGVGGVISLLWFKRSLPHYCTQFIEMCIMLCADHGPCASGAHNTIVTARAGKDLISCLVSGLLTIGPRFGGAIDDAARYFKDAHDSGLTPYEFVEGMKKKGIRVPGIGHRVKNRDRKDKRVELLQKFARTHFPSVKYMEYAVEVEAYTLSKAKNLILNIDGAIGSIFLDLFAGSGMFTEQEIDEIVKIGYLNGFFVLARSIGLIGHTFDQKRLKQPLYRHPWEDVVYTT
ncbi:ATP-citrate synthase beta chain protein 2-like [Vigna umbellata]|uniref:ATP-citrate synthase beta chain protein 2-like n=1 Tax=Vigna umbellata TaxID=87088 RepID=UPI001F5E61AA|nr:ATP-citrate synthase beta chain protein 2-like [Vigna umbellata]